MFTIQSHNFNRAQIIVAPVQVSRHPIHSHAFGHSLAAIKNLKDNVKSVLVRCLKNLE